MVFNIISSHKFGYHFISCSNIFHEKVSVFQQNISDKIRFTGYKYRAFYLYFVAER